MKPSLDRYGINVPWSPATQPSVQEKFWAMIHEINSFLCNPERQSGQAEAEGTGKGKSYLCPPICHHFPQSLEYLRTTRCFLFFPHDTLHWASDAEGSMCVSPAVTLCAPATLYLLGGGIVIVCLRGAVLISMGFGLWHIWVQILEFLQLVRLCPYLSDPEFPHNENERILSSCGFVMMMP